MTGSDDIALCISTAILVLYCLYGMSSVYPDYFSPKNMIKRVWRFLTSLWVFDFVDLTKYFHRDLDEHEEK